MASLGFAPGVVTPLKLGSWDARVPLPTSPTPVAISSTVGFQRASAVLTQCPLTTEKENATALHGVLQVDVMASFARLVPLIYELVLVGLGVGKPLWLLQRERAARL